MRWLIRIIPVYRAGWQSGNRRGQSRTELQASRRPINHAGEEVREPDIIQLNEGVGEHVRIKISPRQKKRG